MYSKIVSWHGKDKKDIAVISAQGTGYFFFLCGGFKGLNCCREAEGRGYRSLKNILNLQFW